MKIKIEVSIETLESFPKLLDRPKTLEQINDEMFKQFVSNVVSENNLTKSKAIK